jgi:hypothetical protein
MKAPKGQLASELLADPKARDQLRTFLTSRRPASQAARQSELKRIQDLPRR